MLHDYRPCVSRKTAPFCLLITIKNVPPSLLGFRLPETLKNSPKQPAPHFIMLPETRQAMEESMVFLRRSVVSQKACLKTISTCPPQRFAARGAPTLRSAVFVGQNNGIRCKFHIVAFIRADNVSEFPAISNNDSTVACA